MRWLTSVVLISVVAACSSDEGALLILHGATPIARVEVVLASPTKILSVKQRTTPTKLDEEDVRYYKQESTSGSVPIDVGGIDGFTIRIAPNPDAISVIPFVLAYDAQDLLVAVGRVHASDDGETPVAIEIPTGRVLRYDVDLEPMAAPDPSGIAANHGTTVRCSRDQTVHGAAWRFAKGIQLRLVFPKANEDSSVDLPYDLDCDDHDTESQQDCDDLQIGFNPSEAEVCNDPDFNCDGELVGRNVCFVTAPGGSGGTSCAGHSTCGAADPAACIPDNPDDAACVCVVNTCASGGCTVEYRHGTSTGFLTPCAPAVAKIAGICPIGAAPCQVTVKGSPSGWTIQVGGQSAGNPVTFSDTVTLASDAPLYIEAAIMNSINGEVMAVPSESFGLIDLEVTMSQSSQIYRAMLDLHLAQDLQANACPSVTLPNGGAPVATMTCAGF